VVPYHVIVNRNCSVQSKDISPTDISTGLQGTFSVEGHSVGVSRKVDVRLPGKENSNPHGARPVKLIMTRMK
jgi:hypothetical protein